MLQLNHCLATSPTPTKEKKLQPRLTRADDITTTPRRTPQFIHNRATGPVSEQWLQQTLLPRLSRRPYDTHRYFQRQMMAYAATEDMATVPAPAPQLNSRRTSQPEPQLSGCQELRANLNERVFAEDYSTTLHCYRRCLVDLASETLDRPPHQGTPMVSRTKYAPLALLGPLSPGSTVKNTEEEHETAIELCLSSYSPSSVKRLTSVLTSVRQSASVLEVCLANIWKSSALSRRLLLSSRPRMSPTPYVHAEVYREA
jgi:hypothetical protein